MGGPTTAFLNRVRVADAILKGKAGGYPADYKLLFLVTINWLNQYGNINKIIDALKKLEFVVVTEQFMTPTAKFADIILPHNTLLERNDFITAPTMFTGYRNQVVDSLGESRSMFEIAQGLAAKLKIKDFCEKTEEQWLRGAAEIAKVDFDKIRQEGIERLPEADHKSYVAFESRSRIRKNHPFADAIRKNRNIFPGSC